MSDDMPGYAERLQQNSDAIEKVLSEQDRLGNIFFQLNLQADALYKANKEYHESMRRLLRLCNTPCYRYKPI